jgi:hypothetical protein
MTTLCATCACPLPVQVGPGRCRIYCSRRCNQRSSVRAAAYAEYRAKRAAERAASPLRPCLECQQPFRPACSTQIRCTQRCNQDFLNARNRERRAAARQIEPRTCAGCDKTFLPLPNNAGHQRYCGKRCQLYAHKLRWRAKVAAATVEEFRLLDVFERDGWTCQICLEPIDPALKAPNQWARSIDHRIPLSRGGPHSFDNCQAAHLWCNSVKKDRDFSFAS